MRSCCSLNGLMLLLLLAAPPAPAIESEGCLNCHQYEGFIRADGAGKRIRDFYVDPAYYSNGLGPHARLECTACHVRAEVGVFPHQKTTQVDCLRVCHVGSPDKIETRFSHELVAGELAGSVHKPDILARSNKLLGSPLADKQAACLLCHDEPSFRKPAESVPEAVATRRCRNCHNASLPKDIRFDFRHVQAHAMPVQSSAEVIRTCGLCHSNTAIRAEFKLPDSTATYLASFHGKAVMLGADTTADCLNCHASLDQNVHAMLKSADPVAPTSPQQLPDTCRASGCHGQAGARISAAAVHLDLGSTRSIEFMIACIFVGIILFTFGPSLLLTALKLFHFVVGKHDPEYHRHEQLADSLLAGAETRDKLIRFQVHHRFQHWLLVVSFVSLCLTGFPMKFADGPWAASVISHIGSLSAARTIHRTAGVVLMAGFVYHLIYVLSVMWRYHRQSGKSLPQTLLAMPLCATPRDGFQMNQLLLYYCFLRKTKPAFGRFGPEEKFEYLGVFWGTFVLGTTGLLLWANAWATRHLPGRILTIAALVHGFEAFLALLHIGVVHMTHVIFSPAVFPLSPAMFTGRTPKKQLVKTHGGLLTEVAAEAGLAADKEVPHV